ncbi:MAG TPA: nucleotidyltransferase domain-containing protein, partial [Planctomycetes bacterium]|nr:nucleotidyltransferase domain-containing protein [Planctomycetota bacterium]
RESSIKWKHAMHLIRLLLSGITALKTGHLELDVGVHRIRLLAIKKGEVPWADLESWRRELQGEFDAAVETSPLPDRPDYRRVERFLIDARRSMVNP